jgi:hypothetical protein
MKPKTVIPALQAVALVSLAMLSFNTSAQSQVATSGSICSPENARGSGRFIRKADGVIFNSSFDKSAKIVCPVLFDGYDETLSIFITRVSNYSNSSKRFVCKMKVISVFDGVIRTINRSKTIPKGINDKLVFRDIRITESGDRFELSCTLPPRSTLGLLVWETS